MVNAEGFAQIIGTLGELGKTPQEDLLNGLGIKDDWAKILENTIKKSTKSTET